MYDRSGDGTGSSEVKIRTNTAKFTNMPMKSTAIIVTVNVQQSSNMNEQQKLLYVQGGPMEINFYRAAWNADAVL